MSFEVMSPGKKRPCGGNGGRGGNIFLIADKGLTCYNFETFHFNAEDGKHGGSGGLTGRNGQDLFIQVPVGTIVSECVDEFAWDQETYDSDDAPKRVKFEMNKDKEMIMVAKGGDRGIGNSAYRGTGTQRMRSIPKTKMPGQPGEQKSLKLELKLIADIGLVGFPNVSL